MSGSTMFGNYTDGAQRVVVLAQEESRFIHDSYIGPEHLLLGLLHAYPNTVQTALGVLPEEVREAIVGFVPSAPGYVPWSGVVPGLLSIGLPT